MAITFNVQDLSLAENITIPVTGIISSVMTDGGDVVTSWTFTGALSGDDFNVNGVPQTPGVPVTVTTAQVSEVTYTSGPDVDYSYLTIEADDSVTGASTQETFIVEFNATGSQPIQATNSNPFFEFHAGGTVDQAFVGNGNHDIIIMPFHSGDYTFETLTTSNNAAVVFTEGKAPSFTLTDIEQVQFADKTMFIENADNANIARLYSAAFDRAPDGNGLAFWEDVYANNVSAAAKAAGYYVALAQTNDGSGASIADGFMQSSEFINRYGTLTDTGFVNALYQNVLGRAPDQAGLTFWTDQLSHGTTRAVVLVGFAESPENVAKTGGDAGWLIQV